MAVDKYAAQKLFSKVIAFVLAKARKEEILTGKNPLEKPK